MKQGVNRDKLVRFLANVDQEIANMLSGEGLHRPGTLHFEQEKNSAPVMNRLEIFKGTPTQENLDKFLELAAQDFGGPTADYFKSISKAIFKVPLADRQAAQKKGKPFDVAIKDAFYDMFRNARTPMEPKQVERLEALSLNLAGVFQSEISKKVSETVKIQLGALVSSLKLQEEQREAKREVEREKTRRESDQRMADAGLTHEEASEPVAEERDILDLAEVSAQAMADQIADIEKTGGTVGVPYPKEDTGKG